MLMLSINLCFSSTRLETCSGFSN